MRRTVEALFIAAIALRIDVGFGQSPQAAKQGVFTFQVPRIRAKFSYPSELSSVKVECSGRVRVWTAPHVEADMEVPIPEILMPQETRDYARYVFWTYITQHPQDYPINPKDLGNVGSEWELQIVTQPVEDRYSSPVPALWQYWVRLRPVFEGRHGKSAFLKCVLFDQEGRVLLRSDYPYAIGRAAVSNGSVTIDLFTDLRYVSGDPYETALLTRYIYSNGKLLSGTLKPFRINILEYNDPTYKDR